MELLELSMSADVRELAPSIHHPALVIHRTADRVIPVARARELADLLPKARLFEQPGEDHFSYSGDVDGWMDEFERFVTGAVRSRPVGTLRWRAVRVVTLGRFAVEVDGEEVPVTAWGSRRARQLCKRLVVARGWPVTRDELFALLWPDEAARRRLGARLSVQLSGVRHMLHGGVIADRDSVRLDLREVDTDLEVYFRATADDVVVAAYPGPFLPEDVYESWTTGVRAEAQARFVAAARREAQRLLVAGDLSAAVQLSLRLREVDGFDEDAHRLLLTALRRVGAVTEAERAHEAFVASMAELGLPAPDLAAFE